MKKFLWLVFIFTLIGCRPNPLQPLTHPDQHIQLGGFSFLPPSGNNWRVSHILLTHNFRPPRGYNMYWETWGRSTFKATVFNKSIIEPNYRSSNITLQPMCARSNKQMSSIIRMALAGPLKAPPLCCG